ncbi:hypothetical protein RB595_010199 [Gaeumannomyces hyphopodioides]
MATPADTKPPGTNSSLEGLQTDEQRRVLDTVSEVRKCGLDTVLSLPQIVVCGDQSAGKSSLLEALTEIPFPRNDNLCTRFATEISIRREPEDGLTIRINPDDARPRQEKDAIARYSESITDLADLPAVMDNAMKVMGISRAEGGTGSAFAKDTLSITIQGPDRPQLTVVDIPGLIQSSTKGVSEADVAMVAEITNSYIKQPRAICLAVVSATHDAANQSILQRVRKFDPQSRRTLGVITKPDRLVPGSGSEAQFLALARNEEVFFQLGWHVVKNRTFDESSHSIAERNASEDGFFTTSNFKTLPRENVGIGPLRTKLSSLLFEHVKKELPRLRDDLETALASANKDLDLLGDSRATAAECRGFLMRLTMQCYDVCKAGLAGNYEHAHFQHRSDEEFSLESKASVARIRAAIQFANTKFADEFRTKGHKYILHSSQDETEPEKTGKGAESGLPRVLSREQALAWAKKALLRSRGTELVGSFNPRLIAELFWEQSEGWGKRASAHVELVSKLCDTFLSDLLGRMTPKDLKGRIWTSMVQDTLKAQRRAAMEELEKLLRDRQDFPINYSHYYTDTVHQKRQERIQTQMEKHIISRVHTPLQRCSAGDHYPRIEIGQEVEGIVSRWGTAATPNMEEFSCNEALDCLLAIYKTQQKTFIANVVTQVVERHIARGLQDIFSPMVVIGLSDERVEKMVSEPQTTKVQRDRLRGRIRKLKDGREIFWGMMDL